MLKTISLHQVSEISTTNLYKWQDEYDDESYEYDDGDRNGTSFSPTASCDGDMYDQEEEDENDDEVANYEDGPADRAEVGEEEEWGRGGGGIQYREQEQELAVMAEVLHEVDAAVFQVCLSLD